jgi:adenylate cyclase
LAAEAEHNELKWYLDFDRQISMPSKELENVERLNNELVALMQSIASGNITTARFLSAMANGQASSPNLSEKLKLVEQELKETIANATAKEIRATDEIRNLQKLIVNAAEKEKKATDENLELKQLAKDAAAKEKEAKEKI